MNYKQIAKETRIEVLNMIYKAQTSHIASCFSATDLAVVLYENIDKENDIVCWSKGWASALIYSLLARHGFIPKEDLKKFPNKPYLALAEPGVNGVYGAGGAMGHLLPIAVGIALGKKKSGEKGMVYCIMSDGELNEGTTWESVMLAAHHNLDNLCVLIDKNGWQAMGKTEDILNINILPVFSEFGWNAQYCANGHDHEMIEERILAKDMVSNGIELIENTTKRPKVIICETIKGKGVSFMEDHLLYHYKYIEKDEYEKALSELQ